MEMQTMTIGAGPQVMEKKRDADYEKLKARCAAYEEQIRIMQRENETAYLRGRIEGLEFAIRCNGVSGGEVGK